MRLKRQAFEWFSSVFLPWRAHLKQCDRALVFYFSAFACCARSGYQMFKALQVSIALIRVCCWLNWLGYFSGHGYDLGECSMATG